MPFSEPHISVDGLKHCARCGLNHSGPILYKPFVRPVEQDETAEEFATHWATCPATGDPILMLKTC